MADLNFILKKKHHTPDEKILIQEIKKMIVENSNNEAEIFRLNSVIEDLQLELRAGR